jgi:hypothetical protein
MESESDPLLLPFFKVLGFKFPHLENSVPNIQLHIERLLSRLDQKSFLRL